MTDELIDNDISGIFLQEVGDLIRGMRASRGMTRKILARDSSVSERYLANLEQGKGNVSINLLRQVALALNTPIGDLLPSNSKQTPELSLISEFISGLSKADQEIALKMLYKKFSMSYSNTKRIALIGLRGAGKTTLGLLLKKHKNIPFIHLASEIESLSGMPVAEIFSLSGQQGYRRFEEKALVQTLQSYQSCCIETGGSIVSEPKELNLLLTTCLVIWIQASPEDHMARVIEQGDMRPMNNNADAMDDLRQILNKRTPYYEQAHATLNTSNKTIEQSYNELVALIEEQSITINSLLPPE